MKQTRNDKSISALCAPVLLLILAAGILTVLLGSAAVYENQNRRGQESGDRRTAALYLTNQVRQTSGTVTIQAFGQGNALVFREKINGVAYLTKIYCYEGWLMELFTPETGDFSPADGEKVLPMAALDMDMADGLLRIAFTDPHGERNVLKIMLMQAGEVIP